MYKRMLGGKRGKLGFWSFEKVEESKGTASPEAYFMSVEP